MEMWKTALQDVQELELKLQQMKENPDLKRQQLRMTQMQAQYTESVQHLSAEHEALKQQLR